MHPYIHPDDALWLANTKLQEMRPAAQEKEPGKGSRRFREAFHGNVRRWQGRSKAQGAIPRKGNLRCSCPGEHGGASVTR